jgi:hypothetical protein
MPAGAAPPGSGNGEVPSSVRLPPLTVDRETVGQHAVGGADTAGHEAEGAIGMDPQHRDLVAAHINGDQEPAVRRELAISIVVSPVVTSARFMP